jgi:hypothetical protein
VAAPRKLKEPVPVAFVWGLPMFINEALAFQAWEAHCATPEQLETLRAWLVAMTLVHGSWVRDELGAVGI